MCLVGLKPFQSFIANTASKILLINVGRNNMRVELSDVLGLIFANWALKCWCGYQTLLCLCFCFKSFFVIVDVLYYVHIYAVTKLMHKAFWSVHRTKVTLVTLKHLS